MNNSPNYEGCDETKFSYISLPNKVTYKRDVKIQDEILFSLVCKGILNVCQLIEDENGDVYSIPINPENVEEKLSMEEILADISLMELLSGDGGDRTIFPHNDERSLTGEIIVGNNLRIYHNGVYSIFDINIFEPRKGNYNNILGTLWQSIKDLHGENDNIIYPINFFLESELLSEKYGSRILKKVEEFLAIYDSEDGKSLFFAQVRQSINPKQFTNQRVNNILGNAEDFLHKNGEEKYKHFIRTLKKLKAIFSKDCRALEKYIIGEEVFEEEVRKQVRKFALGIDKALLKRIINEELG